MSELKAGTIKTPYSEGIAFVVDDTFYDKEEGETLFYLKSEADKVIAHHKYKRCLAMAKWCCGRWIRAYHLNKIEKTRFYARWQNRWLELADKFKPINSTAQ